MVDVSTTTVQDTMDQIGNRSVVSNSSPPSQSQRHAEYLKSLLELGGLVHKPHVSQEQRQADMRFCTYLPPFYKENTMEPQLAAHNIDQRFICNVCGVSLPQQKQLDRHQLIHGKVRWYICNVCGITMKRKEHLERHQRSHSNERPYSCGVCNNKFTRREHLSRHSLIHSSPKAQKMTSASNVDNVENVVVRTVEVITLDFDDEDQPDSFNLKPVPDKLKNTCNNSDSNVIPKFSDVSATPSLPPVTELNPHVSQEQRQADMRFCTYLPPFYKENTMEPQLAAHNIDQRCYICNVCGISMKHKKHLERHQRSHSNERPYSCGMCNNKFTRREHLSRHSLYHCPKAQKMTSASNVDNVENVVVRTVEVITVDSDDEDQPDLFNLKPVPDKPKNTSDSNVIPKFSDVSATPSLPPVTELNVQGPKSYQCDSVLITNLSEAEDTESEIQTEFVTCDNYDQFVHCDKGASNCVQCFKLLIGETPASDVQFVVDPMTKADPDEMDRKDIWSERPAPDTKFMIDPVTKTDPHEMDRKGSWSETPAHDIKFMVDPVTKTDPDEMDRKGSWSEAPAHDIDPVVDPVTNTDPDEMDEKGNWSEVPNSSLPPDVKDTDYLSSLFQLEEEDQKPRKSQKQRIDDVKFITFRDGARLYFCPKCQVTYPDKKLLKIHLVGHLEQRWYICNVCGVSMKRKEHLERHQLSHNNERPYSCGVCSKTFKRTEHLSRHSLIHSSRKAKKRATASRKKAKTVKVNTTDSVGEDQHSSNLKLVPDEPKNNFDNNVIQEESDDTSKSSLLPATELNEQSQKSYQCDSVLLSNLSEAVDTENEITQTEFVTCYNRVFDDHVTNLCTKMGDLIFLSIKETGSYEQRLIATDKITSEQLREKEKKILKTNFRQVHDKYKISFATMFHDVVAVVLSNASTIKLQKILLLAWFLKLFIKITAELLPEHSDSPTSIWKKIIELLSNYENPSPMAKEIFALNEVDFEKECWTTLDLIQQSFS